MWQALNLKNLSEQASNLVAQATEKSGELISQAQDSLRKISNDNDSQVINEDPTISGIITKKNHRHHQNFFFINPFLRLRVRTMMLVQQSTEAQKPLILIKKLQKRPTKSPTIFSTLPANSSTPLILISLKQPPRHRRKPI